MAVKEQNQVDSDLIRNFLARMSLARTGSLVARGLDQPPVVPAYRPPEMRPTKKQGPVIQPIPNYARESQLMNEIALAKDALRLMTDGPRSPGVDTSDYRKSVRESRDRLKQLQGQLQDLRTPDPGRSTASRGTSLNRMPTVFDPASGQFRQARAGELKGSSGTSGGSAGGGSGSNTTVPYQGYTGLEQQALNTTPDWLRSFLEQADTAQQEAKAKNEERYQEILGGYQDRTAAAKDTLGQLGATERMNISDRYKQGRASAEQDLIDRGLGNTTIRSSVMRGQDVARDRALTKLAEDQANLRLQYLPTLEGQRLQFMERRNDVGPDLGQVAQLSAALGQSGFGLPGNVQGPSGNEQSGRGVVPASQFRDYMRQQQASRTPTAPTGGTPVRTQDKTKKNRKMRRPKTNNRS